MRKRGRSRLKLIPGYSQLAMPDQAAEMQNKELQNHEVQI
jgi:hypothetical protein